jgi:hypothetical protein
LFALKSADAIRCKQRYVVHMSSKDNFSARLVCPECGRVGVAQMSENEGYSYAFGDKSTTVESLSAGFRQVEAPSRIRKDLDFQCIDHEVSAVTI